MAVKDSELIRAQELARSGFLYAPASFKVATLEQLKKACDGCGARGSWFRLPKRMYGTLIVFACIIHDWMYWKGLTIEDKKEADRVMQNNTDRLIEEDEGKWYKPSRLQYLRSRIYYLGVSWFGGRAFWKGKNSAQT